MNNKEKFELTTVGETKQRDVHQNPRSSLDPSNVPRELHGLIPYAEKWGISDDTHREDLVTSATRETLIDLTARVTAAESELTSWLSGAEAQSKRLSREYIAFSAMRMLADDIRSSLK